MPDPHDVGTRVLAGLARGRARINAERQARARALAALVEAELERDARLGLPPRGRAARIARRLRISRAHAYRIVSRITA